MSIVSIAPKPEVAPHENQDLTHHPELQCIPREV